MLKAKLEPTTDPAPVVDKAAASSPPKPKSFKKWEPESTRALHLLLVIEV